MKKNVSSGTEYYHWQAEMKLLNNRFFLGDFAKWFGLTMLICSTLFMLIFGIPGGLKGIEAALLMTGIGAVLLIVSTLIFVIIMGNRVPMEFTVNSDGVNMRGISKRMKGINKLAIIMGVLARKPGAIGAGTIGMSQQSTTIPWNELQKVHFYPAYQAIFLKGGIFSRIRLYCTSQNYEAVVKIIQQFKPSKTEIKTIG